MRKICLSQDNLSQRPGKTLQSALIQNDEMTLILNDCVSNDLWLRSDRGVSFSHGTEGKTMHFLVAKRTIR